MEPIPIQHQSKKFYAFGIPSCILSAGIKDLYLKKWLDDDLK